MSPPFMVTLVKEIPVEIKGYKVKATLEFDIRSIKPEDLNELLAAAIKDGYSVTFVAQRGNET